MFYQWLVFAHVLGVFGFLLAHGVSAWVSFRVSTERDVTTLRALLQLSASASMASMGALLVLLAAGIWAAFLGRWWAFGWPWAALGVLVVIWAAMSAHSGNKMRKLRRLLGFTGPGTVEPGAEVTDKVALAAAQATVRPWINAAIGGVGLVVLLWLMVLKPF
ncbi:MAG TPA: hypothetical protein VIG30_14460 [Ktedonobacterales bacterium]|jgi:hypothetical protein